MSETQLVAEDVTLSYTRGGPAVVRHASLAVGAGEAVGIVGESGSGKTTLARALVGELLPRSGTVTINGRPWSTVGRRDRERRAVQMVFQDPYSALNPRMTARATVAEALRVVAGMARPTARASAADLLERVGLGRAIIDRSANRLSGGQRQRVVIARVLACEPDLLIADEPTSSLDVSVQAQILNLLLDLRAERRVGLVLVTHDLAVLEHMTHRVLVMYGGRIVESGSTEQLLSQPAHPYTKRLLEARAPDLATWSSTPGRDHPPNSSACVYAGRCSRATDVCVEGHPADSQADDHIWACYHPNPGYENSATPGRVLPTDNVRTAQ